MPPLQKPSEYRFEKRRIDASVTLSSGHTSRGCLFTAAESTRYSGPERVGDLLNASDGFFPFEIHEAGESRTVLYNRSHVVFVSLAESEAQRDPGYSVAMPRHVSILLSTNQRLTGSVRVYQPLGRDRLSDWARQPETFRYLETEALTLLVNAAHIVDISEVPEP